MAARWPSSIGEGSKEPGLREGVWLGFDSCVCPSTARSLEAQISTSGGSRSQSLSRRQSHSDWRVWTAMTQVTAIRPKRSVLSLLCHPVATATIPVTSPTMPLAANRP